MLHEGVASSQGSPQRPPPPRAGRLQPGLEPLPPVEPRQRQERRRNARDLQSKARELGHVHLREEQTLHVQARQGGHLRPQGRRHGRRNRAPGLQAHDAVEQRAIGGPEGRSDTSRGSNSVQRQPSLSWRPERRGSQPARSSPAASATQRSQTRRASGRPSARRQRSRTPWSETRTVASPVSLKRTNVETIMGPPSWRGLPHPSSARSGPSDTKLATHPRSTSAATVMVRPTADSPGAARGLSRADHGCHCPTTRPEGNSTDCCDRLASPGWRQPTLPNNAERPLPDEGPLCLCVLETQLPPYCCPTTSVASATSVQPTSGVR